MSNKPKKDPRGKLLVPCLWLACFSTALLIYRIWELTNGSFENLLHLQPSSAGGGFRGASGGSSPPSGPIGPFLALIGVVIVFWYGVFDEIRYRKRSKKR